MGVPIATAARTANVHYFDMTDGVFHVDASANAGAIEQRQGGGNASANATI